MLGVAGAVPGASPTRTPPRTNFRSVARNVSSAARHMRVTFSVGRRERAPSHIPYASALGVHCRQRARRVRLAVRAARRGEAEFAVGGLAGPHQQGGARTGLGLLIPLPLYRCHSYSDIECACQLSRYDRRWRTWCL